jgi:hypothetical protein
MRPFLGSRKSERATGTDSEWDNLKQAVEEYSNEDDEDEDASDTDDDSIDTGIEEYMPADSAIIDDYEDLEDIDLEPLTLADRKQGCLLLAKVSINLFIFLYNMLTTYTGNVVIKASPEKWQKP